MLLFFSYFSIRVQFVVRKYYHCGHIINCPINSVESPFGYSPLLYYNYWPVSKFRDRSMKLLSRKNIAPKFKDIERKETFMPDLSGQKWEVHKILSILISKEGFNIINQRTNNTTKPPIFLNPTMFWKLSTTNTIKFRYIK